MSWRELPEFAQRLHWFFEHRPELARLVSHWLDESDEERHLLSLLRGHRMKCLLRRMLDESRVPVAIRHPLDVETP